MNDESASTERAEHPDFSQENIERYRIEEEKTEREQQSKRNDDSFKGLVFVLHNILQEQNGSKTKQTGETVRVGEMFERVRQARKESGTGGKS